MTPQVRVDDSKPEARCVTCGERIEADDVDGLWARYSNHQVSEHGKPHSADQARRGGLPTGGSTRRLTFECRACGNVNGCETAVDWDEPPVACGECGASDWERAEAEVMG